MDVPANAVLHSELWTLSNLTTYLSVKMDRCRRSAFSGVRPLKKKKKEILASISVHAVESAFRFEHGWFHSFEITFAEDKS